MLRDLTFPLLLGFIGITVLCGLGVWQVKRLEWKTQILEKIEEKISAEPTELPSISKKETDQYLSVFLTGMLGSREIHVLTSKKNAGPGFLVISPLELPNGKSIMVDRGFIPEVQKSANRFSGKVNLIGNLLWPNEIDIFTPNPNIDKNIWFGRDLSKMARYLGVDPILVVTRNISPSGMPEPQRIGINIPNNHLNYAVTWFSLAFVWFGMTILLIYRITKQDLKS